MKSLSLSFSSSGKLHAIAYSFLSCHRLGSTRRKTPDPERISLRRNTKLLSSNPVTCQFSTKPETIIKPEPKQIIKQALLPNSKTKREFVIRRSLFSLMAPTKRNQSRATSSSSKNEKKRNASSSSWKNEEKMPLVQTGTESGLHSIGVVHGSVPSSSSSSCKNEGEMKIARVADIVRQCLQTGNSSPQYIMSAIKQDLNICDKEAEIILRIIVSDHKWTSEQALALSKSQGKKPLVQTGDESGLHSIGVVPGSVPSSGLPQSTSSNVANPTDTCTEEPRHLTRNQRRNLRKKEKKILKDQPASTPPQAGSLSEQSGNQPMTDSLPQILVLLETMNQRIVSQNNALKKGLEEQLKRAVTEITKSSERTVKTMVETVSSVKKWTQQEHSQLHHTLQALKEWTQQELSQLADSITSSVPNTVKKDLEEQLKGAVWEITESSEKTVQAMLSQLAHPLRDAITSANNTLKKDLEEQLKRAVWEITESSEKTVQAMLSQLAQITSENNTLKKDLEEQLKGAVRASIETVKDMIEKTVSSLKEWIQQELSQDNAGHWLSQDWVIFLLKELVSNIQDGTYHKVDCISKLIEGIPSANSQARPVIELVGDTLYMIRSLPGTDSVQLEALCSRLSDMLRNS